MRTQPVFKWLTITVIVLAGFLTILLFLGYLLKENEAITTELKAQLEQEALQKSEKKQRKLTIKKIKKTSPLEMSQQKIIADNQGCDTDKQCFLIHTDNQNIGCMVAVNTKGAAILLKVSAQKEGNQVSKEHCQQSYIQARQLSARCVNNVCSF
jgi:hypothetical protein